MNLAGTVTNSAGVAVVNVLGPVIFNGGTLSASAGYSGGSGIAYGLWTNVTVGSSSTILLTGTAYIGLRGVVSFDITNGANLTVSGPLKNHPNPYVGGLTKTNAGTLMLLGTNTYTGLTTISAGELIGVTGGACSNSAVTVAAGATNGVQVLAANGYWTCGALIYSSGATCADFNFGGFTPSTTTAPLQVINLLNFTGTPGVLLRNTGAVGNGVYPLISYGSISGPPPASFTATGFVGSISNDAVHKVLALVVQTVPVTPPPLVCGPAGGGQVNLSWPAAYQAWILEVQTNGLAQGLGTNWVDLGAISSCATNVPLTTTPAVFYRLRYPFP